MRFLAAQFDALISDDLWLRCARHANTMAARLADAVSDVPGLQITRPVQTNAVFAILPSAVIISLQRDYPFYVWDQSAGEVRWMCSWDTTEEDVEGFATAVRDELAAADPYAA
jgi:threonine aldolase